MTENVYSYRTLEVNAEGKYSEKGSKFLATVFPLMAKSDVEQCLAYVRSQHPKTRHICYAYRLLENEQIIEYSTDAGEPGGSAGAPILNALKSHELLNVISIVVRYFGGTKLGIPGLIHAYRESTNQALISAHFHEIQRVQTYSLDMPMHLQPLILEAAKRLGANTSNYAYSSRFSLTIDLPMPMHDDLLLQLLQLVSKREDPELERLLEELDIKSTTAPG